MRRQLRAMPRRQRPLHLLVQVRRFRSPWGTEAAATAATGGRWDDQRRWATPPPIFGIYGGDTWAGNPLYSGPGSIGNMVGGCVGWGSGMMGGMWVCIDLVHGAAHSHDHCRAPPQVAADSLPGDYAAWRLGGWAAGMVSSTCDRACGVAALWVMVVTPIGTGAPAARVPAAAAAVAATVSATSSGRKYRSSRRIATL